MHGICRFKDSFSQKEPEKTHGIFTKKKMRKRWRKTKTGNIRRYSKQKYERF